MSVWLERSDKVEGFKNEKARKCIQSPLGFMAERSLLRSDLDLPLRN